MNIQSRIEPPQGLSIDAFFEWSRRQPERYELVGGTPRLQPWVKLNHNRVVMNLTRILHQCLDLDRYELASGDFAVRVGENTIRYADLMIVPAGQPGSIRFVEDASLIVEVLSDSTRHIDFGDKLTEYLGLESLDTYLIVAQDPATAWLWSRGTEGSWPAAPRVFGSIDDAIDLPVFAARLPLTEVYRNVR